MINFSCVKCGGALSVPDSQAGQAESCPACGYSMVVPGTPVQAPQAAAAPLQPQQGPAAQPGQQVVYVQQAPPGKSVSGLGIAALVLGIFASLGCWIPGVNIVSIVIAALGLVFAIIGFLVALVGGKSGVGMPLAGAIICIVVIIIAVAITGLVVGAVVAGSGQVLSTARTGAANSEVANLAIAVDAFELDMGRYPTTTEGLAALLRKPGPADDAETWRGPYLRRLSPDPWGRAFHYKATTGPDGDTTYKIWSDGPDKRSGTADDITAGDP